MSEELTTLSASRLAELMRRREVSPVEVVEAHLRRLETHNPALNAVVTVAADVLERAREAEAALRRGDAAGALHGVPLTIKDTFDVRGVRSTCGSRLRAEFVPGEDAQAVARLRAAGAVILGKTNCPEFALDYISENPVFGRTLNPHDPSRTPGGSSGGCAAAVAACLTPASLGSDLVGSVRIPAHFCGVAALRPTAGRVPGGGHLPPASGPHALGASPGPIARGVEDLELLFGVLSASREGEASLGGVRVAWYADDGNVQVTEETAAAVREAARALEASGLEVFEERPPGVEKATDLWLALFEHATQRFVLSMYAGREGEAGRAARVIIERAARRGEPTLGHFLGAWEERDRVRVGLLNWMEQTPLVVAPVGAVPAFRHEEYGRVEIGGRVVQTFRAFGYAHAANVFDLPAACVPAGRSSGGLPVGVQIVGRPFEERRVLAAARVVEEALGARRAPQENLPNASPNPL